MSYLGTEYISGLGLSYSHFGFTIAFLAENYISFVPSLFSDATSLNELYNLQRLSFYNGLQTVIDF